MMQNRYKTERTGARVMIHCKYIIIYDDGLSYYNILFLLRARGHYRAPWSLTDDGLRRDLR